MAGMSKSATNSKVDPTTFMIPPGEEHITCNTCREALAGADVNTSDAEGNTLLS